MHTPIALDRLHGPVRLLAGPGAGKTHALVELYADLVGRGLAGRGEILVLTFSTSAAAELERRLDQRLNDSYDQAWISTFHSFCARLLRDHRPDPRRLLLSGFQEWLAMRAVLEDIEPGLLGSLAPVRRSDAFAQDALSFIALLKQNLVHPAAFQLLAEASGSERMRSLAGVYRVYQARLEQAGLVDFRDLVAEAIALLDARPDIHSRLASTFRFILVDEFQDVDPAQFELLRRLAPPEARPHLLVAGDPEQAIYGFRGTVPRLLDQEFPSRYQAQSLELPGSRRCPPEVLAAASRLLDATQPQRLAAATSAAVPPPDPAVSPLASPPAAPAGSAALRVVRHANSVEEAFFVAREVRRLVLEEGLQLGRCAILLRSTTTLAVPFEEALRAMGLPYEVRGLGAISRNEVARFLIVYLRALASPDDPDALERLLSSSLSGAGRQLVGRLRRVAIEEGRAFHKVVRQLMYRLQAHDTAAYPLPWASGEPAPAPAPPPPAPELVPLTPSGPEPPPPMAEVKLPEYLAYVDPAETRALHSALVAFYRMASEARRLPIYALSYRILNEAGVFERLFSLPVSEDERTEALANLKAALDAFSEIDVATERLTGAGPNLEEVAPRLDALIGRALDDTQPAAGSRPAAVQVMTVHQAKGLEFDAVFMAGLALGHFPVAGLPHPLLEEADQAWLEARVEGFRPSWPPDAAHHVAEEARLAYVGMTRARRRLYLSYADEYDQTAGPSPFIELAVPEMEHESPGGSTAALDASAFLTMAEAETLLALERRSVTEDHRVALAGLGVDLEFVFDPASGEPFEPYAGSPPVGVDPGHFSPTSLNNYLKCPRLYWYGDHPGLSAPPRGVEMERGSFLHRVLEDFHKRESEWRPLPVESQREWLEAALQGHLEAYLSRVDSTLERKAEEQEVRRILGNYIQFATSFQSIRRLGTLATELKFFVQVDGHEVRGKIDRINDTGDGTCEVVDYKTGSGMAAQRALEAYFGPDLHDVQLAMYNLACLEGVDEEGQPIARRPRFLSLWYPKDMVYGKMRQVLFAIDQPEPGVKEWLQRVVTQDDLARARDLVVNAINSIGEGDFRPRPKPGAIGTCLSWFGCPHSSICPYGGQPAE